MQTLNDLLLAKNMNEPLRQAVRALGSKQFVPGQPRHGWLCPACWSERNKQETA